MAEIPTPKSYSQILGGMIDSFLSRLGLPQIKKGDPSLSIMEAAAQSDFRNTKEVMDMVTASNLDGADGATLDRLGRDERVLRLGRNSATGVVDISDTSFSKIQTRIYQGGLGITAGSTTISVEDSIPANGQLYLGRGTINVEGPISYTTVTPSGSFYVVALSTATQNYHQTGEAVTYAQGGDRLITAGTVIATPATFASGQILYQTLFSATIPDGETEVKNVSVQAQVPGSASNVPAQALNTFTSLPFPTAAVTNLLPFTNGRDVEDDNSYRERIRLARKSRAKAIKDAIVSGLIGARSTDESGQIVSATTSFLNGEPRTVIIDDGTGYQEKDNGVIKETLVDEAVGGEKFFGLSNRPIAKAYVKTSNSSPFVVTGDSVLTVMVGGVEHSHTFGETSFRDLNNASAFEVASSINSNSSIGFAARVCDSGRKVAIFAKTETNEDLVVQDSGANSWLNLPISPVYTINLYKNDIRLEKDGRLASIPSKAQGFWTSVSSGATLNIVVDGIASTVTFTDTDFINAETPYVTLSQANDLQSWADVFNRKIAGVTTTVQSGKLVLTSNLGRNSRASVSVTGGTLAASLFSVPSSATGLSSDFTMDRNSGQLTLNTPLEAGDTLVAGSSATNAFLQSYIGNLTLASNADLWFVIDGAPEPIVTGIGAGTELTWATVSGTRRSITCATSVWTNVAEGDWLIITDASVASGNRGLFRVAEKASNTVIHVEHSSGYTVGASTLTEGGFKVIRSTSVPQLVTISSSGTAYTPTSLAAVLNAALDGGWAYPYETSSLRIATNNPVGDITLVATNSAGLLLGFDVGSVQTSQTPHFGETTSSRTETSGIPSWSQAYDISAVTSTTQFSTPTNASTQFVVAKFLQPISNSGNNDRRSNQDVVRYVETESGSGPYSVTVRTAAPKEWLIGNRYYMTRGFDITARDTLQYLVDGDSVSGRYNTEMYRKAKVVAVSGTWELEETNGDSLAKNFGTGFNWQDFLVAFKSRTKTHSSPDTSKTILWRWWRHGPEGNSSRIQFQYPTTASSAVTLETNNVADVTIRLSGGTARSVPTFRSSSKLGMAITNLASSLYTYQYVASLAVSAATREIRINYTGKSPTSGFSGTLTQGGASGTIVSDSNPGGSSGYVVLTGVVGTFTSNGSLTDGTRTATSTSGTYGYTTLTLTLPGSVTNHGIPVGETVYFTPGDANFLPGARQVAAASATTLSYIDTVATTAAAGAIGSISLDIAGEVTLGGTSVVTGDISSTVASSAFTTVYKKALKITVAGDSRSWTGQHYEGQAVNTTLVWQNLSGTTIFPLNGTNNAATALTATVNAIANSPVTGVSGVASGGSSTIDAATYESTELGGAYPWWNFSDGYNWVRSTNTPATPNDNFVFTLRNPIAAILASNADVLNEDVRLVPVTAACLARYLNSTAVSGLSSRGGAWALENGSVQLYSDALGSESSIQVYGGSATSSGTNVRGASSTAGLNTKVTVDSADGLGGLQWVWAQNSLVNDKTVFTSATKLDSIDTDGLVTLDATTDKAWTKRHTTGTGVPLQIEKQGDLVCLTGISAALGGTAISTGSPLAVGDWLWVRSGTPVTGTVAVDPLNQGFFRIVAIASGQIFIENDSAVSQLATADLDYLSYNSIIPGDSVSFGSTYWGDNVGVRTVTALGNTEYKFYLSTDPALQAVGTVAALGTSAPFFRVITAVPNRSLALVLAIGPNGADSMDVLLDGVELQQAFVNETFGTSLIPVNKLGFSAAIGSGTDAYKANTGLIAEANKILFGDETNPTDYPGITSAGASYNISGPRVKRLSVAVAVRPITGVSTESIRQQVSSAIAGTINKAPHGTSIAIGSLVAAAQSVNGVSAVTMLSPTYSVGNDQIIIQPYEKAMILDLENDVTVSFIGED